MGGMAKKTPKKTPPRNRAIFPDKDGGSRYQGVLSPNGSKAFESARKHLALRSDRADTRVSDADVIEYVVLSWRDGGDVVDHVLTGRGVFTN